jgi:hypothetical protein
MRTGATALVGTIGLAIGCAIGFVDCRPTWDDTGVTIGSVLLASLLLAAARPRAAWLVGPVVGLPVLAFNVVLRGTWAAALAILVALAGAAVGYGIGRVSAPDAAAGTTRGRPS